MTPVPTNDQVATAPEAETPADRRKREEDEATADEAVDRQYRATIEEAVLRPDCLETLGTLQRSSLHVQIVSNIDD